MGLGDLLSCDPVGSCEDPPGHCVEALLGATIPTLVVPAIVAGMGGSVACLRVLLSSVVVVWHLSSRA